MIPQVFIIFLPVSEVFRGTLIYFYIYIPIECNLQCTYNVFIILYIKINGICFLTVPKSVCLKQGKTKKKEKPV